MRLLARVAAKSAGIFCLLAAVNVVLARQNLLWGPRTLEPEHVAFWLTVAVLAGAGWVLLTLDWSPRD